MATTPTAPSGAPTVEIIDAKELAARLRVPESWIRSYSRERCPKAERIPHLQFTKYVRYEWLSPGLEQWIAQHRSGGTE
jgi:hypothetical protein